MCIKNMKHVFVLSSIILALGFSLAACGSQPRLVHKRHPASSFKVIILRETWLNLRLGYEGDFAQATLRSADISNPVLVLGEDQIEKYDWDLQTITLSKGATDDLGSALAKIDAIGPDEIEKLKDLKENLGWGNPIERALYIHPFIVQVDHRFKYGGIFLDAISQMGIDFPVARVTVSDGKAIIALLPTHIPFVMIDPIDGNGNLRKSDIAEEAEDDVQQLDFFGEWSAGIATSETSISFRAIIRDEAIKLIFDKTSQ